MTKPETCSILMERTAGSMLQLCKASCPLQTALPSSGFPFAKLPLSAAGLTRGFQVGEAAAPARFPSVNPLRRDSLLHSCFPIQSA